MLNINEREIFKAKFSGKELDLGTLTPSKETHSEVLEEMTRIGLLKPVEALNTAYKVNADFYFEGRNADGEMVDQEFKIGRTIGLSSDGSFTFEDASGEVFVAEMNAQAEADKESVDEAE